MASASENPPAGAMAQSVTAGFEIPPEPPEVGARALSVAARLLAGATIFFFLAFAFAYFYLRSLNVEHLWRPAHIKPDQALGAAMIACVIVSVLLTLVGERQLRAGSRSWLVAAFGGVLLGLAAIGVQCWEYTVQNFGPADGAFASVFCAWSAMYLFAVLFTVYWLETQVASELRARREPAPEQAVDIKEADRLIAPGLHAAAFYWVFLAAIGVVTYVALYLL